MEKLWEELADIEFEILAIKNIEADEECKKEMLAKLEKMKKRIEKRISEGK